MIGPKTIWSWFRDTISEFLDDDCMALAASISYYTVFSLPPLLLIVIAAVGLIFDRQSVENQVIGEVGSMIGPGAASQIEMMIGQITSRSYSIGVSLVPSLLALGFAATGAFVMLQSALNRAWGVKPDPTAGGLAGIRNFFMKRLLSLGMILGMAFLLLVSLVLSAGVTAWGKYFLSGYQEVILRWSDFGVSLLIFTVLFAALFKWLPDARIDWTDVWAGAVITALLFMGGKSAIGFYIGRSNIGETYGAAGALAVIMLWVYYSAVILLLGAEFTQVRAAYYGKYLRPEAGAVRVERVEKESAGGAPHQTGKPE